MAELDPTTVEALQQMVSTYPGDCPFCALAFALVGEDNLSAAHEELIGFSIFFNEHQPDEHLT